MRAQVQQAKKWPAGAPKAKAANIPDATKLLIPCLSISLRALKGLGHFYDQTLAQPCRRTPSISAVDVLTDLGTEFDCDTARYREDDLHGTFAE